ncbi:MAG: mechanosensitive ion channel family protein [Rhizobiaceae bacterium]|nr:mechanosensitive ion channel family protein [Rhizobiaceae bacterium]
MRLARTIFVFVLLAFATVLSGHASAQTASVPSPAEEKPQVSNPADWTPILDNATRAVEREGVTERELDRIIADTNRIREDANVRINELQPRVDEVSQQLSELGKQPAEGEPEEPPEARERRDALNSQFAKLDAELKAAKLAAVRAQQLQRSVIQSRQSKFFRSISVRSKGVYTIDFWTDFVGGISGYVHSFNIIIIDGLKIAAKELLENSWKMGVVPFFLIATIYFYVRIRRLLSGLVILDQSDDPASIYKSRFIEFCRDGALPAICIFLVYRILWDSFLLTPRLGQLLASFAVIAAFYVMSIAMLRIVLMPRPGRSRILLVNDLPARRVVLTLTVGLTVSAIIAVFNAVAIVVVSRLSISVGLSFLFAIAVAISFLLAMWIVHKDRNYTESLSAIVAYTARWRFARGVANVAAIVILFAALFGYIAFAEFLAQQLIFCLVVICSVWLILRFVHNVVAPSTELAQLQAGQTPDGVAGESTGQPSQLTILGTGLLTLFLYLAAALLLMLPWGYRTSDFFQVFERVFFGFEIGGLRFSISTVLLVIALFVVGYTVTVSLRNWLNNKFLPATAIDIGIANSISTVFGYIGFILAAIFAVSVAGFDLSNLAIVAGALSVGVGFGLQSIVNNFVSGLILLAERPIKAGDWIVTSGGEGIVTKISVRSTEIETFDRSTVIIPNSTLITDNVTNWTHENKTGRIIVPVGVSYDSDVEQVKEILLECAKEHRLILGRPAPVVYFMDFGASSLDFQLRCFLADINNCLSVQSELRFAILAALREANIEIPFPQRDLHIRSGMVAENEMISQSDS